MKEIKLGYTVIQHEPRIRFGLSLNEYAVASIVYHLSHNPQAPVKGWCTAGRETIGAYIGLSRRTIITIIKRLQELDLIQVHPDLNYLQTTADWFYNFEHSLPRNYTSQGVQNLHRGCEETAQGGVKKLHRGCEETAHNNNTYTNRDNNRNNNTPLTPQVGGTGAGVSGFKNEEEEKAFREFQEALKTSGETPATLPAKKLNNRGLLGANPENLQGGLFPDPSNGAGRPESARSVNDNNPAGVTEGADPKTRQKGGKRPALPANRYEEFLSLYNEVCERRARVLCSKTKRQVDNLYREGYTTEDFRQVFAAAARRVKADTTRPVNPLNDYLTPEYISRNDKFCGFLNHLSDPVPPLQQAGQQHQPVKAKGDLVQRVREQNTKKWR